MIIKWYGKQTVDFNSKTLIDNHISYITCSIGNVETGSMLTKADGYSLPETKKGVAIEFKKSPSIEVLKLLDNLLYPLVREGQSTRNLLVEIDDLKARIDTLEKARTV